MGSIGVGGTNDSYGNRINEPFSTPYETGGFDLDAVGVIHQLVSIEQQEKPQISVYPNPVKDGKIQIKSNQFIQNLVIFSSSGQLLKKEVIDAFDSYLELNLSPGIYSIQIQTNETIIYKKIHIY